MREAAPKPRRPHRHGRVLAVEVGFGDSRVRDSGRVGEIEKFEKGIFVRYGEEDETVRSGVPRPGSRGEVQRELERGVRRLGRLQAQGQIRSSDDVEPFERVEVSLVVVHARQDRTSSIARQSPSSSQLWWRDRTTSRTASRASGSDDTDQSSSPVSATAAARDEPWERITRGSGWSVSRM